MGRLLLADALYVAVQGRTPVSPKLVTCTWEGCCHTGRGVVADVPALAAAELRI